MKIIIEVICASCEEAIAGITIEDRDTSENVFTKCQQCGNSSGVLLFPAIQDDGVMQAKLNAYKREILELRANSMARP